MLSSPLIQRSRVDYFFFLYRQIDVMQNFHFAETFVDVFKFNDRVHAIFILFSMNFSDRAKTDVMIR